MGRLIEYVAAHEVGHTLGFQHNMKRARCMPPEKIRDAAWVKKMGHTPVVDGLLALQLRRHSQRISIDPEDLIPRSGRTTSGRRCGATSRFPASEDSRRG
jgi:hypothetical protein